jgi:PleD family two-component response regulator
MTKTCSPQLELNSIYSVKEERSTSGLTHAGNNSDSSISIMYLDDLPDTLLITRIMLEETGKYCVVPVSDPFEAVEMISQYSYDCILSDYKMPKMDGISFLKKKDHKGFSHLSFSYQAFLGMRSNRRLVMQEPICMSQKKRC